MTEEDRDRAREAARQFRSRVVADVTRASLLAPKRRRAKRPFGDSMLTDFYGALRTASEVAQSTDGATLAEGGTRSSGYLSGNGPHGARSARRLHRGSRETGGRSTQLAGERTLYDTLTKFDFVHF